MANMLQLKVTMCHLKPPIWRRVEVPDTLTFWEFHFVLQILFDWQNSHLFEFRRGRGTPDEFLAGTPRVGPDTDMAPEWQQDCRDVVLANVLTAPKQKLTYVYDFGDYWEHEIVVEKVQPLVQGHPTPAVRCLAGRRAAPSEDIGGFPGYDQLMEVLTEKADGKRKQLPGYFAGLGKYDPNEFDLASFNHDLGLLRQIVAQEDAFIAEYSAELARNPPSKNQPSDLNAFLNQLAASFPSPAPAQKKKPDKKKPDK